jgi:hypothetical protein
MDALFKKDWLMMIWKKKSREKTGELKNGKKPTDEPELNPGTARFLTAGGRSCWCLLR